MHVDRLGELEDDFTDKSIQRRTRGNISKEAAGNASIRAWSEPHSCRRYLWDVVDELKYQLSCVLLFLREFLCIIGMGDALEREKDERMGCEVVERESSTYVAIVTSTTSWRHRRDLTGLDQRTPHAVRPHP